jgi:hypothetical protein
VLVAVVLSACANAAPSTSATVSSDTAALQALERPIVRDAKTATTALAANDLATAADGLSRIGQAGVGVLVWLDAHPDFERANQGGTACLRETMTDLGEQAKELPEALRGGSATAEHIAKLRRDLTEAANCIQSSD